MDDDSNLVVCQRVSRKKAEVSSEIRQCSRCKQAVYVSLMTLARIETEGKGKPVVFSCTECMHTFDIDLSETQLPSPEQIREIEAATNRKMSDEDLARGMERFKQMYRRGRSERN